MDADCSHEIKRSLLLGSKGMTNLDSILKSRDITLLVNVCIVKVMVFPVVMYGLELDHKTENWIDAFKLWCWRRLLDSKEIKPVNPKGNQHWIFTGRTVPETEGPIFWPPYVKSWLIGIESDAGKDWRQKEKRVAAEEMVRWHHWLNEHEFEQTQGDSEGQRRLMWCSLWGHKESDTT